MFLESFRYQLIVVINPFVLEHGEKYVLLVESYQKLNLRPFAYLTIISCSRCPFFQMADQSLHEEMKETQGWLPEQVILLVDLWQTVRFKLIVSYLRNRVG